VTRGHEPFQKVDGLLHACQQLTHHAHFVVAATSSETVSNVVVQPVVVVVVVVVEVGIIVVINIVGNLIRRWSPSRLQVLPLRKLGLAGDFFFRFVLESFVLPKHTIVTQGLWPPIVHLLH